VPVFISGDVIARRMPVFWDYLRWWVVELACDILSYADVYCKHSFNLVSRAIGTSLMIGSSCMDYSSS
jgi:hypothetical protein